MEELIQQKIQSELLKEKGKAVAVNGRKSALKNGRVSNLKRSQSSGTMVQSMKVEFTNTIQTIHIENQPDAAQSLEDLIQKKLALERDRNDKDAIRALEHHIQRKLTIERIRNSTSHSKKTKRLRKSRRHGPEIYMEERLQRKTARIKHRKDKGNISNTETNYDYKSKEDERSHGSEAIEDKIQQKIEINRRQALKTSEEEKGKEVDVSVLIGSQIQTKKVKEQNKHDSQNVKLDLYRENPRFHAIKDQSEQEASKKKIKSQIRKKVMSQSALSPDKFLECDNNRRDTGKVVFPRENICSSSQGEPEQAGMTQSLEAQIQKKIRSNNLLSGDKVETPNAEKLLRSHIDQKSQRGLNNDIVSSNTGSVDNSRSHGRNSRFSNKLEQGNSLSSSGLDTSRHGVSNSGVPSRDPNDELLSQLSPHSHVLSANGNQRNVREELMQLSHSNSSFGRSGRPFEFVNQLVSQDSVSSFLVSEVSLSSFSDEDDDDFIVDGVAVNEYGENKEQEKARKKTDKAMYVSFVFIFVIAILISGSIPVAQHLFSDHDSESETVAPTSGPSLSPSTQPSSTRFIQLIDIFSDVSDINSFYDKSSPQFKAIKWLAYVDQTALHASNLKQRYVLAVFYFAMNGDNWSVCANKIDGCRCSKSGIAEEKACQEVEERHTPQLSLGSECNWFNYRCDETDTWIVQMRFGGQGGNGLRGTLPSELRHLNKLKIITFANNAISGTIPDVFHDMKGLLSVVLPRNKLTGQIPDSLFDCNTLRSLDLGGNQMSGTLSPRFGKFKDLKRIDVDGNSFNGLIPSEIGNITGLGRYICFDLFHDVKGVDLESFLVSYFGDIDVSGREESFVAWRNEFTGTIPQQIVTMKHLTIIDIRHNHINGTIPMKMNLPSLKNISISHNRLEGTISEELFENSKSLSILDVAENSLSGTISSRMTELPLSFVSLFGNNFNGTVPPTLCSMLLNGNLLAGCPFNLFCEPSCCPCIL